MKSARMGYIGGPLLGAALFTAVAVLLAASPYWPASFIFFYCAALMAACFRYEYRRAKRRDQEMEWWRNRRAGIPQKPLDPCCVWFEATSALHDDVRCTRERGDRLTEEEWFEWSRIVAELGDLGQEEEAGQ